MGWQRRSFEAQKRARVAELCLAFSVISCPLLLGGGPVWVSLIAFILVLGASIAMLPTTIKNKREPTPVILVFFTIAGCLLSLRLIPGIGTFLGLGNSYTAVFPEGFSDTLSGKPGTLHMAPGSGYWALLHLCTVGLTLGTTHRLCRRYPRLRERILRRVVYGGAIVAGIGFLGFLLNTDLLTWVYTPIEASRNEFFTSTFLNPNHLSGYLVFIMGIGIAISLRDQSTIRRFIIQVTAFLCGCGAFLTLSRAGISGLIATMAILGVITWFKKRKVESYKTAHVLALLGFGVGSGLVALVIASQFVDSMDISGLNANGGVEGKIRVLEVAWETLQQAPLLGIGPGSFGDISAAHQTADLNTVYTHVENMPLQILIDHGVLLGSLIIASALWYLVKLGKGISGDPSALLMFSSVAILLWHNFFDFNLSFAGAAIPAAVTIGVLSSTQRSLEINAMKHGVGTILLILFGLWALSPSLENAHSEIQHRTAHYVRTAHGLNKDIIEDLKAYPKSPELMTAAGLATGRKQGVEKALPYYEYARKLGPQRFFPSLMCARTYQQLGRTEDAAKEYAHVCSLDRGLPKLRNQWMASLLAMPKGKKILPGLTKLDSSCTEALIKYSTQNKETKAVLSISLEALRGVPGHERFLYWHARSLWELGRREEASKVTGILLGLHPDSAEGFLMQGIIQRNTSGFEAMHLFNESLNRSPNWNEPALYLAETAIQQKDRKLFLRAMHGLSQSGKNRGKKPQMHALEGEYSYAEGKLEQAARSFRRAGPWLRNKPALMLKLLDCLQRLGKVSSAKALCKRGAWPDHIKEKARKICDSIK